MEYPEKISGHRNSSTINAYFGFFSVVNQYYEAEVVSEYVIRGNTAVLKCNIPSFVADFVRVEAWVGSDSSVYLPTPDYGKYLPGKSSVLIHVIFFSGSTFQVCFLPFFLVHNLTELLKDRLFLNFIFFSHLAFSCQSIL